MFKSYFLLRKYRQDHIDYGLPFTGSQDNRVKAMVELSKVKPNEVSLDLGAGDGKVVIAFAQAGAKAYGVEIDPTLVELARYNIRKKKLDERAQIKSGNFWEEPFNLYDIITIYGMDHIMGRLESKIEDEAKCGCRILCNYFGLPKWQPDEVKENVFLYVKK